MPRFIAHAAAVAALALALVPVALAAKPGGGGHGHSGGSACTQSAPGASVDNTWAWAQPGSWALPGQQIRYAIDVFDNDLGCGSSSFVVDMPAPSGFNSSQVAEGGCLGITLG